MSASSEEACSTDDEFDSSKLGTKEHWDSTYERELQNFNDNGDVGEIWFGEESVERVVRWVDKCPKIEKSAPIVDLGCGNGIILIELHKLGFTDLVGVDYAPAGIELARNIAKHEGMNITYEVIDILQSPANSACLQNTCYKLCIDKGTYDAISLCPEHVLEKRKKYTENVASMLTDDGLLVITSCNWTKEELLESFSSHFSLSEEIPTPTFSFGGVVGRRETSLVFHKRTDVQ